jgi:shikimate kinase
MGRHIVLIGFMGAGKSSVARCIASELRLPLVDTDENLERQEGMTVAELFVKRGEQAFRDLEAGQLASLLGSSRSVVSCGGGVVTHEPSCRLLAELGCVVYLRTSISSVLERISDKSTRPLLAGSRAPGELLAERLPLYEQAAEVTISTDGKTVAEVASAAMAALQARGEV